MACYLDIDTIWLTQSIQIRQKWVTNIDIWHFYCEYWIFILKIWRITTPLRSRPLLTGGKKGNDALLSGNTESRKDTTHIRTPMWTGIPWITALVDYHDYGPSNTAHVENGPCWMRPIYYYKTPALMCVGNRCLSVLRDLHVIIFIHSITK